MKDNGHKSTDSDIIITDLEVRMAKLFHGAEDAADLGAAYATALGLAMDE